MIKRIKNKHLLSSKTNDVSKNPIRVLYKKVGQPSEVKIISDVYKLKKAIIERSLDIIPYEKIFIICHSKKSNSNMFPNIFLPLKRIQGLNEYMLSDTDKKLLMLNISSDYTYNKAIALINRNNTETNWYGIDNENCFKTWDEAEAFLDVICLARNTNFNDKNYER